LICRERGPPWARARKSQEFERIHPTREFLIRMIPVHL